MAHPPPLPPLPHHLRFRQGQLLLEQGREGLQGRAVKDLALGLQHNQGMAKTIRYASV